jgi:predicted nuclease of predicted toxin-antitoxin system
MAGRIRFHLDEQVDVAVARSLRRYGVDVTTTIEAGLRTASDEEQLAYARREQRVLVTHDADFLRLAAVGSEHAGIAFCPRTGRSVGEIIRSLLLIHEVLRPEEIRGRVEFL